MPRYFFHLRGPHQGQYVPDESGHFLPDTASAKLAAAETVRQLLRTNPYMGWESWNFDVVDEEGQLALILPFAQRSAVQTKPSAVRRWFSPVLRPAPCFGPPR